MPTKVAYSANDVRTKIILVLLIIVPAFVNFFTPIYNYSNPELFGLPFFYWFQTVLLASMTIPYLVFTHIQSKTDEVN